MTSGRASWLLARACVPGLVLCWGCSDLGQPVEQPCVVSPSSLEFGLVEIGSSSQRVLRVTNAGGSDLVVDVTSLCGTGYDVVGGAGSVTVAPGDFHDITVRFTPQTTGELVCDLGGIADCAAVLCSGLGVNPQSVSFAADVQPIFNDHCIGCHRFFGEADLDLREGFSYAETVNQTTRSYAPAVRVKPADLDASVLFQKVTDTGAFGDPMPPPGGGSPPVTAEGIAVIRAWILEGARNN